MFHRRFEEFDLDPKILSGFRPGSTSLSSTVGELAHLGVDGALTEIDVADEAISAVKRERARMIE